MIERIPSAWRTATQDGNDSNLQGTECAEALIGEGV